MGLLMERKRVRMMMIILTNTMNYLKNSIIIPDAKMTHGGETVFIFIQLT